jgi:hypothetical protein
LRHKTVIISIVTIIILAASVSIAQRNRRDDWDYGATARDTEYGRDFPTWEVDKDFPSDTFTFVRIKYDSHYGGSRRRRRGWGGGGWETDFPECELNFSLRLHQVTSLKVNPNPIYLELTDPRLFDFPFIYIIEPGRLEFRDAEVLALRKYLENGGFLMVDDFWGQHEWDNFHGEIKRVFPKREPEDLPLSHEIFHCVYRMKEKPQIPSIGWGRRGREDITYEENKWYGPNHDTAPHYRAIKDDAGRIMVFICHNTDLGDGWEEEANDPYYFAEFSVKKAYPLGINIVTYAMTH